MILQGKKHSLDLTSPHVMGILNITPDSFSDGSQYQAVDVAIKRAELMMREGASIIDIGGESTRPGAAFVSENEELERVIPIIEKITQNLDVMVSIDTYKPKVMLEACNAGAELINDIKALQEVDALSVAAQTEALVCLMHMQGEPRTMQSAPIYNDLIDDIHSFFQARIEKAISAGISKDRIILDPGFGFGKTTDQNYQLLANYSKMNFSDSYPWLIGVSRKSMIGNVLSKSVSERLAGSLAAALYSIQQGARIIRVHDVAATVDAIKVFMYAKKFEV